MAIIDDEEVERRREARRNTNLSSSSLLKATPQNSPSVLKTSSDARVFGSSVRRKWQPGDPWNSNFYFGSEDTN